jgi:hypothetical protein
LLDRLADALRTRGYVAALRQAYVDWARRYIHFHQSRHPQDLGAAEVAAFLASLVHNPDLPPAAEGEARAALAFLYEVVLGRSPGDLVWPPTPAPGAEDILRPRADGAGPRLAWFNPG